MIYRELSITNVPKNISMDAIKALIESRRGEVVSIRIGSITSIQAVYVPANDVIYSSTTTFTELEASPPLK